MSLNGIDISSYQADLNLNNICCDFVVIKATEGKGFVNSCCNKHVSQAKQSNKLYGLYHYAKGLDPVVESNYFINNIKGYLGEALLALDFEKGGNSAWDCNPNKWIKIFCDNIAEKTGIKPIVYIQASALNKVQGIGDYGLWVAQYANNCDVIGFQGHPWNEGAYKCAMRQYTSHGKLPGYNGYLDFDKFYGDTTAWHKYANPKKFK